LGGVKAAGSLAIDASGSFGSAPVPSCATNDISFSNAYTNVPVDFFNGFMVVQL
jgi:hypothetical protein